MSTRRRLDLRLPSELVERVDARAAELGQTRTKFVERALEAALGSRDASEHGETAIAPSPAPPRAPEPEKPYELPKIAKRKL